VKKTRNYVGSEGVFIKCKISEMNIKIGREKAKKCDGSIVRDAVVNALYLQTPPLQVISVSIILPFIRGEENRT